MKRFIRFTVFLLALVAGLHPDTSAAQTVAVADATISWALDKGADSPANATVSADGLFSVASFSYGSNLTIAGTRAAGDVTETLFQPVESNNTVCNDANALTFTVKPKRGLTFTPRSIAFCSSRVGTNGGKFDVVAEGGGHSVTLAEGVTPQLIKEEPYFTSCAYDLTPLGPVTDGVTIRIYIKNIANNKQYGYANVVIAGDVSGEVEAVPSYTFSAGPSAAEAGTVTATPSGTQFDEGTLLTVSATENFGYHFAGWADAEGSIVSTDNPYTFEITANTVLTATYNHVDVYPLRLTIEGGANANLVQLSPEGTLIGGVRWYEEGTDVKLTALNNRILTFTHWDDNTTSAGRDIVMDGEKNVVATFAAADFIVGWDLYNDEPASERAADYRAETDNAGLLSLRNADGRTTSWLSRGIVRGQENGKYAARIWKYLSEKWYFELSFSSKEYSDLVLSAAVADDYNTYSIINVQYSTDGANFTTFGTYNPPSRGWDSREFPLPADAAGQERVYIRFMPDYDSPLVGVGSDYDGMSVAELFVLAMRDAADDNTPPRLVSTIPADGQGGASATGSVILTFDEKVTAAGGDAMLGDEVLKPIVSGRSVVYPYAGLRYNTSYTFTLPAGAVTDRSGNAFGGTSLTFTTMERNTPEPRLFDVVVAQDGSGDHTTVQAAIDAAPAGRVKPWLIFVKNGRYKEHVDIPASKPWLHITGQDRDKTVICDDRLSGGDNAVHVSVGATVVVNSDDCMFENITIENSYGHEQQNGPQALALNTGGDRAVFNNVAMLSYQDTWITPSKSNYRVFARNCLIEGAVDFIYNSGNVYLEADTLLITRKSGGYIVAPSHAADVEWGYVFNHCVITAPGVPRETTVWLGRPWHNYPKTVFLNTRAEVTIPATGWYETMGGLPAIWADWNTVDADGNLLDLSQRRDTYYYTDSSTGERVYGTAKNRLTDEEAAQYTIRNVLSGSDNWQPELKTEACEAPAPVVDGNTISWPAVPYAICYVVTRGDEVAAITTSASFRMPDDDVAAADEYRVRAVSEYGVLSSAARTSRPTSVAAVRAQPVPGARTYYTAAGMQVPAPVKGLNIVRRTSADGTVTVAKVAR